MMVAPSSLLLEQCGIAMVGGADFIKTGDEEGEGAVNKAVIGDIIIVCAQVIVMLLMSMENGLLSSTS